MDKRDMVSNSRWGRLCSGVDATPLAELVSRTQAIEEVLAWEGRWPKYKAGVFQVLVRPDGIWIHSCLLRQVNRRAFFQWMASCDGPPRFPRKTGWRSAWA